jgi:hypothetical protein
MQLNWISIIALILLISPLLFGLWRGLPSEIDKLSDSIYSIYSSIIWLVSYGVSFWLLRMVMVQGDWDITMLQWLQQQLKASIFAWVVAVPVIAILCTFLMRLLLHPLIHLLTGGIEYVGRWTERFPTLLNRILSILVNLPKAALQTLLFLLVVHVSLLFLPVSNATKMAESSLVYQWTDQEVINPLLASTWSKQLPVLGKQTEDWFHQISQEAAKYGPKDSKSFWTWQTRFDSNEQIDKKAQEIVKGAKTDRQKAYLLYKWIGENITYDDNKAYAIQSGNYRSLTYGAIPTYQTKKGICSDYSALLVAMGKAVGLEIKQELGQGVLPDGSGGPHAWNVVYLKDEQKSIPCDPTWEHAANYFDNKDFYQSHYPEKKLL